MQADENIKRRELQPLGTKPVICQFPSSVGWHDGTHLDYITPALYHLVAAVRGGAVFMSETKAVAMCKNVWMRTCTPIHISTPIHIHVHIIKRDGRWCRPLPLSHTLGTLTHSSLWPTMASLNVLQLNGSITSHISPSHTKARGSTVSEFILESARMIESKKTDE